MDFLFQLVRMSGEFHANSVPISVKFNAAGVLNGTKKTPRLAVNTGSKIINIRF